MNLILIVILAVLSAAGLSFQQSDALPQVPGRVVARDAIFAFVAPEWDCSPRAPAGCARFAVVALQDAIPGLTWAQMAAIIVQTEFNTVWDVSTRDVISELVWRRLLDTQSGAVRYDGLYHVSADDLIATLGTFQGVTDAVRVTEGHAVVHVARLTGLRDCEADYCRGYLRYVDYLAQYLTEHIETLRTGLGPRVPSASGLFCMPDGGRLLGDFFMVRDVGACGDGGRLVFLVVGTGNRHAVWRG